MELYRDYNSRAPWLTAEAAKAVSGQLIKTGMLGRFPLAKGRMYESDAGA